RCTVSSISRRDSPFTRSPYPTFSATVMCGKSEYCWKTMPRLRCRGGRSVTSRPSMYTRPESTCSRPAMIRISVVFPQPLSPSSVRNSPSRMSRSIESAATVEPNRLTMPRADTLMPRAGAPAASTAPPCDARSRSRFMSGDSASGRKEALEMHAHRPRGCDPVAGRNAREDRLVLLLDGLVLRLVGHGQEPQQRRALVQRLDDLGE